MILSDRRNFGLRVVGVHVRFDFGGLSWENVTLSEVEGSDQKGANFVCFVLTPPATLAKKQLGISPLTLSDGRCAFVSPRD